MNTKKPGKSEEIIKSMFKYYFYAISMSNKVK